MTVHHSHDEVSRLSESIVRLLLDVILLWQGRGGRCLGLEAAIIWPTLCFPCDYETI